MFQGLGLGFRAHVRQGFADSLHDHGMVLVALTVPRA